MLHNMLLSVDATVLSYIYVCDGCIKCEKKMRKTNTVLLFFDSERMPKFNCRIIVVRLFCGHLPSVCVCILLSIKMKRVRKPQ